MYSIIVVINYVSLNAFNSNFCVNFKVQKKENFFGTLTIESKLSLTVRPIAHPIFSRKISQIFFRKDVLEQKLKKTLEEIGFSKRIVYKVHKFIFN